MYVDAVVNNGINLCSEGVGLTVYYHTDFVEAVLGKLECTVVEAGFHSVDENLFKACGFIKAMAEPGRNGFYDNEAHLGYILESILNLEGVFAGLGDFRAFLILNYCAILG